MVVRGYEVSKGEFIVLDPDGDRRRQAREQYHHRYWRLQRLATLRAYEDTLILKTMFWPDEIRSTGALDLPEGAETKVRAKELEMARSLVANLADKFRPDSYTDAYRTALENLIEQKMRGETRTSKRRKPEPKVIDLMDALKASVDAAKGGPKPKKKPARKKTAKRSAA